ncbi:MAG: DUF1611 domain-containing protein [Pseudomonadota bacterium]
MTNPSSIQMTFQQPAAHAKWSFVTRRVNREEAIRLLPHPDEAGNGDLILAEVTQIGSHKRLQLSDGRFSPLWPGDRIVVACADRFAADQFEGHARLKDGGADLLAGGGVAGEVISKNGRIARATRLSVVGRLAGPEGTALNLSNYSLPAIKPRQAPLLIGVLGTGMNAGKTAAAAGLVNGFARLGKRVAAIKATGTGAFGDVHEYEAAGAAQVLDFTDTGMASTYRQPLDRVQSAIDLLISHAADCEVGVIELADGVSQVETAALLSQPNWAARFDGLVLAAPDAMAAQGGLAWLGARGLTPIALSGLMTRAPICVAEAEATGLPVFDRHVLADPATASALTGIIANSKQSAA